MKPILIPVQAALFLASVIVFSIPPANAFNFIGRATDDSVCDFSPMTSYFLAQRTAVPAGTQNEASIYARLVLRTAAQECKNGQVLILHSNRGLALDASYFPQAANQLCTVADIQRREAGTKEHPKAFELRCTITKMDFAKTYIAKLESQQTTESLIIAGQPQRSAEPKTLDPFCVFGKHLGLCGGNEPDAPPAPARDASTDTPCVGAIITASGCKK